MAVDKKRIAEILASARKQGRLGLLEHEAKQVLAAWGVPVARTELAGDAAEAVRIARELRYPVVMKIASPDIVHKSDAGGVRVGLSSELEVRQAFDEIVANARAYKPDANILGVVVQEYLPQAMEVIIGTLQDPSFGATVMFGLGGVWVEVLKDVSFRLAPLDAGDAREMIQEIKGHPVLMGVRGEPQADIGALIDILQKVGRLAHEFPGIAEMDLNPVFLFERGKGAIAIDARIILGEGAHG
ncbi:MAG: acetate--CoA ligase family protein [Candidatus Hodarchaeaceae archaeon]|nr:acetate--CoA ligase family protein [Candidatus Hodarchaeaceae archaeon]